MCLVAILLVSVGLEGLQLKSPKFLTSQQSDHSQYHLFRCPAVLLEFVNTLA